MPKYTETAAAARNRPNLQYFWCRACNPDDRGGLKGFYFSRRAPADPFNDPAPCPNCGALENAISKDKDGNEMRWPGSGRPLYDVMKLSGHREIAEWKRQRAVQDRKLPYNAPAEQYLKIPFRFIDAYSMKLRHLDLHVLIILMRLVNHGGQTPGWTPPFSQRTIATYCMPPGRSSPINRETIQDSLERLHNTQVEIWNAATEQFITRPLVEIMHSHPKRFKVNMP